MAASEPLETTSPSSPPMSSMYHQAQRHQAGAVPLSFVLGNSANNDFIDLTNEVLPSTTSRTRRMSPIRLAGHDPDGRAPKRRRSNSQLPNYEVMLRDVEEASDIVRSLYNQDRPLEKIDLTSVEDDAGFQKVQEEQRRRNQLAQEKKEETQRIASVKRQQELSKIPPKLAAIQCVVCMENMTDITATACGHLYCHTCITEALIAGENQGPDPGKGPSRCPVCRKKVIRSKDGKESNQVIPLEFMLKRKSEVAKGKERAEHLRPPHW